MSCCNELLTNELLTSSSELLVRWNDSSQAVEPRNQIQHEGGVGESLSEVSKLTASRVQIGESDRVCANDSANRPQWAAYSRSCNVAISIAVFGIPGRRRHLLYERRCLMELRCFQGQCDESGHRKIAGKDN